MADDDEIVGDESDKSKVIGRYVDQLRAHFDTVQIFCSRVTEDGSTQSFQNGSGNWMARVQHARQFVLKDDESLRIDQRNNQREDDL